MVQAQRHEELKRKLAEPPSPLFREVRALIIRKCNAERRGQVREIFEKQAFGELERLVDQTLLDVAKGVARDELKNEEWLRPVVSPDPSDPKLAHLDGLNLSRAWMLEGIAEALPKNDRRVPRIRAAAEAHQRAGLAAVTGEHYEGGHWLGSFAVYLVTRRGIPGLAH